MSKEPFDRADHCRRIASKGGRTTVARHGSSHMSAIGVKGFLATAKHFQSMAHYKMWLADTGAHEGWRQTQLPATGKFASEKPTGPWDPDYVEF